MLTLLFSSETTTLGHSPTSSLSRSTVTATSEIFKGTLSSSSTGQELYVLRKKRPPDLEAHRFLQADVFEVVVTLDLQNGLMLLPEGVFSSPCPAKAAD